MKIRFDKERFLTDVQMIFIAPQFGKLKKGNLGEWLLAFCFIPIGLLAYPITALYCTRVARS